ncbi:hypothetical protein [Ligilactobacillus sp. LYQ60]|uniref:hypothetical protein n=1 Tax=Ligilactobacillus sp. LYQ60 TaxID=3378799 RepID=UPI0038552ACD
MSPVEFRAAERGYQLRLLDEQEQRLTPQIAVDASLQGSLTDYVERTHQSVGEARKKILEEAKKQKVKPKQTVAALALQEILKERG